MLKKIMIAGSELDDGTRRAESENRVAGSTTLTERRNGPVSAPDQSAEIDLASLPIKSGEVLRQRKERETFDDAIYDTDKLSGRRTPDIPIQLP